MRSFRWDEICNHQVLYCHREVVYFDAPDLQQRFRRNTDRALRLSLGRRHEPLARGHAADAVNTAERYGEVAKSGTGSAATLGKPSGAPLVLPNAMHISPAKASFAKCSGPISTGSGAFAMAARSFVKAT